MIKFDPNQLHSLQNRPNSKATSDAREGQQRSVVPNSPVTKVSLSGQLVSSFSLYQKTVINKLEQALPGQNNARVGSEDIEKAQLAQKEKRADIASSNILNFVSSRLQLDQAEGASEEELESRLAAALKGYESGYGEANSILDDMGLLSEDVASDISLTDQKVREGLAQLAEKYLSEDSELRQQLVADGDSSDDVDVTSIGQNLSQLSAAEGRSFRFELETKDGDKVYIDARSLQGASFSQDDNGYGFAASSESEFALRIEGDLDDDELAAINDLLKDVNSLSEDFYAGDMQKALEKALSLGYDSSEIGSFSLNLTQMTSVKAVQAYQPEQPLLKPAILSELKPLGKYASQVAESLVKANEHFNEPRQLLSELLQNMAEMNKEEGKQSIVEFYSYSETLVQQYSQKLLEQ